MGFAKQAAWATALLAMLGSAGLSRGQTSNGIGYPSPAAALQALRARPDVVFFLQNGWLIAADRANGTTWSFPPASDPAYPTAVKRQIVQDGSQIYVATNIMCDGPKVACDALPAEFRALDQKMRLLLQAKHNGNP